MIVYANPGSTSTARNATLINVQLYNLYMYMLIKCSMQRARRTRGAWPRPTLLMQLPPHLFFHGVR